jgi:hypothetical protein
MVTGRRRCRDAPEPGAHPSGPGPVGIGTPGAVILTPGSAVLIPGPVILIALPAITRGSMLCAVDFCRFEGSPQTTGT